MKFDNILQTIGDTPVVRLNRLFDDRIEAWMKVERFNPGSSIKDRIALAMIETAERDGLLREDTTIIEPTSGNTGIGLAMVCAVKGYRLILTMPESMSIERRKILKAYGAELVLTAKELGMSGAIAEADKLSAATANSWVPSQFSNPANSEVHRLTTAREILADFPEGLDYIITGVGTGGHITGVAEALKPHWPDLKVIAVEPAASPVLSGGTKGLHRLQGIGAGFVPEVYNAECVDGVIGVDESDAFAMTVRAAKEEGLLVGISSGASLAAVADCAEQLPAGSRVLVFSYDTGERYLSIDDLFQG
mgnify:CR=1 FL=1